MFITFGFIMAAVVIGCLIGMAYDKHDHTYEDEF